MNALRLHGSVDAWAARELIHRLGGDPKTLVDVST